MKNVPNLVNVQEVGAEIIGDLCQMGGEIHYYLISLIGSLLVTYTNPNFFFEISCRVFNLT